MLHFWLNQILLCKAEVASPYVSSTHSDTSLKKKKLFSHFTSEQTTPFVLTDTKIFLQLCATKSFNMHNTHYFPKKRAWCDRLNSCLEMMQELHSPSTPSCAMLWSSWFPLTTASAVKKSDWCIDLFSSISQIYAKNNGELCPYWGYNTSN